MQQHKYADALVDFERALALIEEGQEGPEKPFALVHRAMPSQNGQPTAGSGSLQKADQEKASTHILTIQAHRDLANHAGVVPNQLCHHKFPAERL